MSTVQTIEKRNYFSEFKAITKHRLALSVVFSSVAGYLIAVGREIDWLILLLLSIGGYCMVGASNAYNQIIEKDLDKLMDRTKNRPIPSGKISVRSAFIIATVLTVVLLASS